MFICSIFFYNTVYGRSRNSKLSGNTNQSKTRWLLKGASRVSNGVTDCGVTYLVDVLCNPFPTKGTQFIFPIYS